MDQSTIVKRNVLIVGGNGLIGSRIAQFLEERNSNCTVFIGSRSLNPFYSRTLQIDVTIPETFHTILKYSISLVVLSAIDKADNVLKFCIENGIDYIDITKPTPDLEKAYIFTKSQVVRSQIVFSSGWMSGVIGSLVAKVEPNLKAILEVKIFVFYSIDDLSGDSSALFMAESVAKPFNIYDGNKAVAVKQFTYSEYHNYSYEVGTRRAYSFDTPDLFILNKIEKIATVDVKTTYSSQFATWLLSILQEIRVFSILPLSIRKLIFKVKGKGDQTLFDVIVKTNSDSKVISVRDSFGQAHLTSVLTVLHIEKMLESEKGDGVYFSHQLHNPTILYNLLSSITGVNIIISNDLS